MRVVTCPEEFKIVYPLTEDDVGPVVFMAGGITGCPDWQSEVINHYKNGPQANSTTVLLNPRRTNFDITNPRLSEQQIAWECRHIRKADWVYFWFPKEGKCLITLYELGEAIGSGRNVRVACHPEYERAFDVHQQLALALPELVVMSSLEELYSL